MTDLNSPENPNSQTGPGVSVPLPLKIAVYGMGLGLMIMAVLLASRFMDRRADRQSSAAGQGVPWEIEVGNPAGGGVKSAEVEGRILTIVIEGPTGEDQVILIDTRKGEVIGRVQLAAP